MIGGPQAPRLCPKGLALLVCHYVAPGCFVGGYIVLFLHWLVLPKIADGQPVGDGEDPGRKRIGRVKLVQLTVDDEKGVLQ